MPHILTTVRIIVAEVKQSTNVVQWERGVKEGENGGKGPGGEEEWRQGAREGEINGTGDVGGDGLWRAEEGPGVGGHFLPCLSAIDRSLSATDASQ